MKFLILLAVMSFVGCNDAAGPDIAVNTQPTVSETKSPPPAPSPALSPPDNKFIGEPKPSTEPLPPDAKGVQAAIDVVHEYYNAIAARDYQKAYGLWSQDGAASHQTFEEFRDGFADTASVRVDTSGEPGPIEGAAGSRYVSIPVVIYATAKGGAAQTFSGEYTLRRTVVDGATPEQRMWRIYSAEIRKQK